MLVFICLEDTSIADKGKYSLCEPLLREKGIFYEYLLTWSLFPK